MRSLYIANTQFLTKKSVCNLSRKSLHPILFRLRIERGGVTSRNHGSKMLSNNDDNGNENGQANNTFIERFSFECRKVIGFALSTRCDWLKRFAPPFHPIRSKTKANCDALACIFPRFASATCNYFEF